MHAVRQRGLRGKARRVRDRNRVERLYHQQMLYDYFTPPPTSRDERHIPIRGRSEFLPSAAPPVELSNGGADRQLDLPLSTGEKTIVGHTIANKTASKKPGRRTHATPQRPLSRGHRKRINTADTALRFVPGVSDHSAMPLKPPKPVARRRKEFTVRGFLSGCAMGGAAAAIALVVLQMLAN